MRSSEWKLQRSAPSIARGLGCDEPTADGIVVDSRLAFVANLVDYAGSPGVPTRSAHVLSPAVAARRSGMLLFSLAGELRLRYLRVDAECAIGWTLSTDPQLGNLTTVAGASVLWSAPLARIQIGDRAGDPVGAPALIPAGVTDVSLWPPLPAGRNLFVIGVADATPLQVELMYGEYAGGLQSPEGP